MPAPGRLRESRPQRLARVLREFAQDPVAVGRALPGEIRQRHWHDVYRDSEADQAWFERLHVLLGSAWPCPDGPLLDGLMADIDARLAANGLHMGRSSYGWYSDAEISLCRAVWCVTLHTRPSAVIETGVAHGVTSRIVLEALGRNDHGQLWSIDLPHPLDHRLHAQTGVAVPDACRERWTYIEGSSRRRLPALVAGVGEVGMFIHDSLHTARNTLFEMEQAAAAMRPGGVMLVDDIKTHRGFETFARRHPGYRTIVCEAADQGQMFGIAVNAG